MEFKDYYAALGVERTASQDDIRQAYRKLARKYHPDVSKEANAEARFKEVAEAHEALKDPERRAAYDDLARRHAQGQRFEPPPGWNSGYEFSGRGAGPGDPTDFSEFFETLFGRAAGGARGRPRRQAGDDHHAKVQIDIEDAYRGGRRTIALRVPTQDVKGRTVMGERQLEVNIPKGVREGQRLRLTGQGEQGHGGEGAGDLYLEIEFAPHPHFRVEGRDVYTKLAIAPWEAALGATVDARTPDGSVQLNLPAGSTAGRKMRLKGKGLPGQPAGDLYVELSVVLPPAQSKHAKEAFAALAKAFPDFDPRSIAIA